MPYVIKILLLISLMLIPGVSSEYKYNPGDLKYTSSGTYESLCSKKYNPRTRENDYNICSFCAKSGGMTYAKYGRLSLMSDAKRFARNKNDESFLIPCKQGIQIFRIQQGQYYNSYSKKGIHLHNEMFKAYKNKGTGKKNSNSLYVCYDSKSFNYQNKVNYQGCIRSSTPCKRNNKMHFGRYPNKTKTLEAFRRCQKSTPKFID